MSEEEFDILDEAGVKTGERRKRSEVHALGLFHRAVHVWLFAPRSGDVLLQRRASIKDSWPDLWDISCAGHLSAGQDSLSSAQRELEEELGISLPRERFEYLFEHFEKLHSTQRGKAFINNEFNDVYVVTLSEEERAMWDPKRVGEPGSIKLQEEEVSAVEYRHWKLVEQSYVNKDPTLVPLNSFQDSYARLFAFFEARSHAGTRAISANKASSDE